jgi:hypothetical protein
MADKPATVPTRVETAMPNAAATIEPSCERAKLW